MKSLKIHHYLFLLVGFIFLMSCESENEVPDSKLPPEIQAYLDLHFPNNAIVKVTEETKLSKKEYEIELEGGFKLEFDQNNNIEEIKGVSALPDSVIPDKILAYINQNYPSNTIVGWEIEDDHQEIKLDNGLEIDFTMDGEFIGIDD